MEPGLVPQGGDLRLWVTTLYGAGFEGNHFSRDGNAPDGTPITVPLYRHLVSLDYAHIELGAEYAFTPKWSVMLRVPWDEKRLHASIQLVDPATPEQRDAMLNNVFIHHRTATYRGFSDFTLLAHHRVGDHLIVGTGFTIPAGHTVPNPYILGDRGIPHVHIQFGTGTFDPVIEAAYAARVTPFISMRAPLYENSHGYRGPTEMTGGVSASHALNDRVRLRADVAALRQGYAHWDGVRDENTGLISTSASIGVSYRTLRFDIRVPISQRTLAEGDSFKQGPTFCLGVRWMGRLVR